MQTPRDVRDQDTNEAMNQSSWTSSEDTSAEDSCTDEEHDQELFLEPYAFTTKSEDAGSMESLRRWFSFFFCCIAELAIKPCCENHARKMRTFFTRRLEPKTKSGNAFKWSLRPKRK